MRLMRDARRGNTDTDDQFILANNHLEEGKNHSRRGNSEIAKSHFLKAKVIFEKIQSKKGLGEVYINLGELYEDLAEIDFSYTYFQQALDCFNVTEQENRLHCFTSLGSLCIENKEYSAGIKYTKSGYELAEVLMDYELQMSNYINHGIILANRGEKLRAEEFFNKAKRIAMIHSLDVSVIPQV
jgi:tetratricopeptide (TPR) repeat protein